MRRQTIHGMVLALLCASATSATSEASYIPFSGSGTSGTISTPPGSITWSYPGFVSGVYVWGTPGLGAGGSTWGGTDTESEFTITFTGLPSGVMISPVDLTFGGLYSTTRFENDTDNVTWHGTISNSGTTVTFFAPAGLPLKPSDNFFINVAFTGDAGQTVNFSGAFDAVPEPSTLSMMASPILIGIGYLVRKRRTSSRSRAVARS